MQFKECLIECLRLSVQDSESDVAVARILLALQATDGVLAPVHTTPAVALFGRLGYHLNVLKFMGALSKTAISVAKGKSSDPLMYGLEFLAALSAWDGVIARITRDEAAVCVALHQARTLGIQTGAMSRSEVAERLGVLTGAPDDLTARVEHALMGLQRRRIVERSDDGDAIVLTESVLVAHATL
jgi:hypothetical protein